jgi:hypothetical protein
MSDAALDRAINYELLKHFLAVERITGAECNYSERSRQKPYKNLTCYGSNMKMILPVMLAAIPKPTTTLEQWQRFNNRLKELILSELRNAGIPLEQEFSQLSTELTELPPLPEQIAYKIVTNLLRCIEFNLYQPSTDFERKEKEKTMKDLLTDTGERFLQSERFFKQALNPNKENVQLDPSTEISYH